MLIKLERYSEAVEDCREVLEKDPDNLKGRVTHGFHTHPLSRLALLCIYRVSHRANISEGGGVGVGAGYFIKFIFHRPLNAILLPAWQMYNAHMQR